MTSVNAVEDAMETMKRIAVRWALAGPVLGAGLAVAGCGGTAITPELRDARAAMDEARASSAASLKPGELLAAERTLARAEAAPDASPAEADLAYVAERQTRGVMAEARRTEIEQRTARDRERYQRELEALARSRGERIEQTERRLAEERRALADQQRALADQQRTVVEQQRTIEERDTALEAEQQARREAEERAEGAMARLRELAAVRQESGETVITLSGEVIFESDRATLIDGARERLVAVADALRSWPDHVAVIEGYTDSRGSDDYNQRLSQRRAQAVLESLIAEGVPAARLSAVGHGEARPVATNDSAEGRALNRRVEIHLRPLARPSTEGERPDAPRDDEGPAF